MSEKFTLTMVIQPEQGAASSIAVTKIEGEAISVSMDGDADKIAARLEMVLQAVYAKINAQPTSK